MEDINKIIGKNLMKLRKNAKLTQLELAEKFNYTDKSVSKWENGESLPSIEVLCSLAEFYGVSLDDLTKETNIIQTKNESKKAKKIIPLHLIITLLAVCAVWVCATILFVVFKLCLDRNYYIYFMWAVPISCIILIVFNSIWGKSKYLFPILSVLIWTVITSFYLQFLKYNLWPLFIIGIPLQIVVIICLALITPKRTKSSTKTNDDDQPKPVKEKKQKPQKQTDSTPPSENQAEQESKNKTEPQSENKIEVTLPQIQTITKKKD